MSNSELFQSLFKLRILFSGMWKARCDIMDWGLKQTQLMDRPSQVQLPDICLSETLDCSGSRNIYPSHFQTAQDWGHKHHSKGNLRICLLALDPGMQLCSTGVQFLMLPDPYSAINNQKYSLQKWQWLWRSDGVYITKGKIHPILLTPCKLYWKAFSWIYSYPALRNATNNMMSWIILK